MVSVEVQKTVKSHCKSTAALTIAKPNHWYSVGSSELCDINCHLFRPDEGLKLAFLRGFIFVRIGTRLLFGFGDLSVSMSRGVKVSFSIEDDSFRFNREAMKDFFESFYSLYLSEEYSKLRRNVVAKSELLHDFSLPFEAILSEVSRQVSCQVHVLSFQVGMEISKLFEMSLALFCDFCFEGPLFGVLNDEQITEVVVNGASDVWVERCGQWDRASFPFCDWSSFESWLLFQSSFSNTDIFGVGFFSDFVLRSGVRVHMCRSPVARSEGYVSMRRHRMQSWKLGELARSSFMTLEQRELLMSAIESRMNLMVVGPTSSGKTTLLSALVGACGSNERILLLEDTPELRVSHDHSVYLQTLTSVGEDDGIVTLNDLVRNALRMRPDRIVVGECRGDEVFALLNALQTGHTGSMCTLHAKNAQQSIARLRTLLQRAEPSISDDTANKLISLGLDLVVVVTREATGDRRIAEIREVRELLSED